jgi:hypothetical protein
MTTHNHFSIKSALQYGGLTLLAIVVVGYGMARASDLLFGIDLHVAPVANGQTVTEPLVDIAGSAKRAVGVSINGHTVPLSQDGTWKDTIVLLPGYNPIHVTAADKFGRETISQLSLFYKAPEKASVPEELHEENEDEEDVLLQTDNLQTP